MTAPTNPDAPNTPNTPDEPAPPPGDAPEPESESEEVTADNAADILAADDETPVPAPSPGPSRRGLLIGGGVAAAALLAGGAWLTIRRRHQGVTGAARALPLVIGGDICAAPLYAAYYQGYFSDAGLNVTLARTQRTEDTKDAVGAGKYIGAPGIFFS